MWSGDLTARVDAVGAVGEEAWTVVEETLDVVSEARDRDGWFQA